MKELRASELRILNIQNTKIKIFYGLHILPSSRESSCTTGEQEHKKLPSSTDPDRKESQGSLPYMNIITLTDTYLYYLATMSHQESVFLSSHTHMTTAKL